MLSIISPQTSTELVGDVAIFVEGRLVRMDESARSPLIGLAAEPIVENMLRP